MKKITLTYEQLKYLNDIRRKYHGNIPNRIIDIIIRGYYYESDRNFLNHWVPDNLPLKRGNKNKGYSLWAMMSSN